MSASIKNRSLIAARIAPLVISLLIAACGGSDGEPVTSSTLSSRTVSTVNMASTSFTPATSAIWQPTPSDTWQWQLQGNINTSYNALVYDIDLFDSPNATIQSLKAARKKIVCYFSAGSAEEWRSDYHRFLPEEKGSGVDGWAGEYWLDTRSSNVRQIMRDRLDLAVQKGCDGVEPDLVEAYTSDSGFPLTRATQVEYNRFIAQEAHNRGLAVGLKNVVELVDEIGADFDFAVNEQCHEYAECDGYNAFIQSGKPVFNAEYLRKYVRNTAERATLCASARAQNMRTLVLPVDLDDRFRYSCD